MRFRSVASTYDMIVRFFDVSMKLALNSLYMRYMNMTYMYIQFKLYYLGNLHERASEVSRDVFV